MSSAGASDTASTRAVEPDGAANNEPKTRLDREEALVRLLATLPTKD